MQNAECRMQNAELGVQGANEIHKWMKSLRDEICRGQMRSPRGWRLMRNAKCKMQNAECALSVATRQLPQRASLRPQPSPLGKGDHEVVDEVF